jgi:hypothetical protein
MDGYLREGAYNSRMASDTRRCIRLGGKKDDFEMVEWDRRDERGTILFDALTFLLAALRDDVAGKEEGCSNLFFG